ncbi:GT2 family glycosyltransferase [Allostreptomyces psammosilenae]|uniref:GT2 family glycosyltransferase n=1 Tax=Allostreptomyces psammosilenae TaxID=1892865 RepID=A0A853ACC5_9ACTN|nr:GT2 family glycosyltransferase [Allostreptomyces psammosilenae]
MTERPAPTPPLGPRPGQGTPRTPGTPGTPGAPGTGDVPPTAGEVSVVICAYTEQRWEDILAAVGSLRAQRRPPLETLLVVDHNARLHDRLAEHFAGDDTVRLLENEQARGLSGGKNTGAAHARGRVVAYLDDDAVADRDWVGALADGYADPAVVAVGGHTLPSWDIRRPLWFPPEFDWVVGCSYRGLPAHRAPVRNLSGGNASFRREVFERVGGFRTDLGRSRGGRPMGCEETEFCIRLSRLLPGSVLLYEPAALIHHRVPEARTRFGYFQSRCYAEGLSKAQVARLAGRGAALASERRHAAVALPRGVVRGLTDALRGRPRGLGQAGAIVTGTAAAAWGLLRGTVGGSGAAAPVPPTAPPAPAAGPAGALGAAGAGGATRVGGATRIGGPARASAVAAASSATASSTTGPSTPGPSPTASTTPGPSATSAPTQRRAPARDGSGARAVATGSTPLSAAGPDGPPRTRGGHRRGAR